MKLYLTLAMCAGLVGCVGVRAGIVKNGWGEDDRPVICAPCVTIFACFAIPSERLPCADVGFGVGFDYANFPWFIFPFSYGE